MQQVRLAEKQEWILYAASKNVSRLEKIREFAEIFWMCRSCGECANSALLEGSVDRDQAIFGHVNSLDSDSVGNGDGQC
jgi:hypothetical protein